MPQYYQDRKPSKPWAPSEAMNASIVLDQPGNISFTNLDQISGRVVLRCAKSSDVDQILVKLEGESRTRLMSPERPGEKQKPQLEYHKILYKVQLVFPPQHTYEGRRYSQARTGYTLPAGTHEYPFQFKFPFNNSCHVEENQRSASISFTGAGLEMSKPPTRHVKTTLPPTLSGFPGEAEIRYFVKATVGRHNFWRENLRVHVPFNFFPIEPPRAAPSGSEVYARQKHSFNLLPDSENSKSKVKNFFKSSKGPAPLSGQSEAPNLSIDARLPEPAILTCNQDIPLRLIVKKLNECDAALYLQSLQVSLIGLTKVRAHDVHRTETNSWIITSTSNMNMPIGSSSNAADTETMLDDHLWRGKALPTNVAPSFVTCNIERSYQLDVRVGISYAGVGMNGKPQTVVLPLRLDVQVYSGIAPPKQLLEAMAEARASIRRRSTVDSTISNVDEKKKGEGRKGSNPAAAPAKAGESSAATNGAGEPSNSAQPPQYSDAPPSYEDAMASTLAPVDAPRPDYEPPPTGEDEMLRGDEKKGFGRRRDS